MRKGKEITIDTSTRATGLNLENHAPAGKETSAAVTHHTPCNSPASNGEISNSVRMNGRNRPNV